jgi:hypothetical protein
MHTQFFFWGGGAAGNGLSQSLTSTWGNIIKEDL